MKNIDKDVETNQQSEQVSNSPLSTFEKIRSVMQYLSFSVGVVLIALRIKPQDTIPNMITLYGLGPFLILAAMVSAVYPTLQQIKWFSFVILALQALAIILLFSTFTEPISVKELVVVYPLIIVSHLTHFSIYAMRIIVGVSCGAVSSPSGDVGSNLIFVFAHLDCAMTLLWYLILYSRSLSSRSKSRLAKPSAPHIKVNSFGRHDSIGAGNAGTSIDVMTMSNFSRAPANGTDAKKPLPIPTLGHPLFKTDQKLLANQQYLDNSNNEQNKDEGVQMPQVMMFEPPETGSGRVPLLAVDDRGTGGKRGSLLTPAGDVGKRGSLKEDNLVFSTLHHVQSRSMLTDVPQSNARPSLPVSRDLSNHFLSPRRLHHPPLLNLRSHNYQSANSLGQDHSPGKLCSIDKRELFNKSKSAEPYEE